LIQWLIRLFNLNVTRLTFSHPTELKDRRLRLVGFRCWERETASGVDQEERATPRSAWFDSSSRGALGIKSAMRPPAWRFLHPVVRSGKDGPSCTSRIMGQSEEAEDEHEKPGAQTLILAADQAPAEIYRIRLDTYVGMGFSNLTSFFIIVTTATTLNSRHHQHSTSSQAAEALRQIAGVFTFAVVAAGIIGTGMLAVPVLAGSAAYVLGEAFGWSVGLARLPLDAKAFDGTVAVATLVGVFINFVDIDPIKALAGQVRINAASATARTAHVRALHRTLTCAVRSRYLVVVHTVIVLMAPSASVLVL